jgi:hypothetical protein
VTTGPVFDVDIEKIRLDLEYAQRNLDRFLAGPMRNHFEKRVRQLQSELEDSRRSPLMDRRSELL